MQHDTTSLLAIYTHTLQSMHLITLPPKQKTCISKPSHSQTIISNHIFPSIFTLYSHHVLRWAIRQSGLLDKTSSNYYYNNNKKKQKLTKQKILVKSSESEN